MHLPAESAAYDQRVRFGRYVARRLRRAGYTKLAKDVQDASTALRTLGRNWEDSDDAIQDALADRDGADDDLDEAVQTARTNLAGRSARAAKEEPYTLIFPDGVGYYTEAPVGKENERYELLVSRLGAHLGKKDATAKSTSKSVATGLAEYAAGVKAQAKAQSASKLAAGKLTSSTNAWTKKMEQTYGALVSDVGKARAEKFFPQSHAAKSKKQSAPSPSGAPPAQG